jgi:hypothetical protein
VYGPLPEDSPFVLHSCHRRNCIAPLHLRAGTPAQNSREMVEAGRSARGERNPNAKLTARDVRRARRLVARGLTYTATAARFGVTRPAVTMAVKGITWRHVQ